MFLKYRNIISKIKRSKVTDYAALIYTPCDYSFETNPFCHALSIKDLENLAEFNLLQNLHLCTQKSVVSQTWDLLEKLALIFLHNFYRERSLLKL